MHVRMLLLSVLLAGEPPGAGAQLQQCQAFAGRAGAATLADMNLKCCNDGRASSGAGHRRLTGSNSSLLSLRRVLQTTGAAGNAECSLSSCTPACAQVFLPIYREAGCRQLVDEALAVGGGQTFFDACMSAAVAGPPKGPAASARSEDVPPLGSAGCGGGGAGSSSAQEWVAGATTDQAIDVGGVERLFLLHFPASFKPFSPGETMVIKFSPPKCL
jgi:hypothetical protein